LKKIWKNITLIGEERLTDQDDLRQLKLLNSIVAVGTINLFFLNTIAALLRLPAVVGNVSVGIGLALLTLLLNKKGLFRLARIYFICITILFGLGLLIAMSGRDGGTQLIFILAGTLHLVLFKDTRSAIPVFLVVVLVLAFGSYWVENHEAYLDHLSAPLKRISFYLNILSTMVLVFVVVLYFKSANLEFETTITEQNKKITQKNKDILDSISYAKRLQQAILPPESTIKQHLPESYIFYKPKDIVAGDFYWFHSFDSENSNESRLLVAAADCTGHGVPGAMVSVVCSNALNRAVKEFGITRPAEVLNKVRELVIETFEKSEDEVKDGMDVCLLSVRRSTNSDIVEIEWAGANNPLWIIESHHLNEIKADKQPIGKYAAQQSFTNHKLELKKGDNIYLFTDGLADQFGGPRGKKFKYKQLKEILLANARRKPDEQREALQKSFDSWKGNMEQVDDVCVIGIRV
jgi:serine phosphatase RsbU (regulator of sigma subunit)